MNWLTLIFTNFVIQVGKAQNDCTAYAVIFKSKNHQMYHYVVVELQNVTFSALFTPTFPSTTEGN